MRKIACLSDDDRRELFRNTADKMGLNDAIVEKDFWVCFTLDYLFHRCPWKDSITFKGGTSLSKAFNLISRFSEESLSIHKFIPWCAHLMLNYLCCPACIFAMFLFEILVEIIHFNLFISCAWSHTIQRKTAFLRLKSS